MIVLPNFDLAAYRLALNFLVVCGDALRYLEGLRFAHHLP